VYSFENFMVLFFANFKMYLKPFKFFRKKTKTTFNSALILVVKFIYTLKWCSFFNFKIESK
jgi:hypothetical protein